MSKPLGRSLAQRPSCEVKALLSLLELPKDGNSHSDPRREEADNDFAVTTSQM
jgi:hypothetical protein